MTSMHKNKKGMAAVEFLIVLPVILLIFSAIVEFGNVFIRYNILNKSIQNAVRYSVVDVYGSLDPNAIASDDDIKNVVVYGKKLVIDEDEPILSNFSVNDVTITNNGGFVVVTASYKYTPIFNYIPFNSFLNITIHSSSVMRSDI